MRNLNVLFFLLKLAVHDCFGESERVASQDDQTQTTGYLSRWHQSAPESEIEDRLVKSTYIPLPLPTSRFCRKSMLLEISYFATTH